MTGTFAHALGRTMTYAPPTHPTPTQPLPTRTPNHPTPTRTHPTRTATALPRSHRTTEKNLRTATAEAKDLKAKLEIAVVKGKSKDAQAVVREDQENQEKADPFNVERVGPFVWTVGMSGN